MTVAAIVSVRDNPEKIIESVNADSSLEHNSYYGTPIGSTRSTPISEETAKYLQEIITPRPIIRRHAGFFQKEKGVSWSGWITSGGNILMWAAANTFGNYILLVADGRRHGIPWHHIPNEVIDPLRAPSHDVKLWNSSIAPPTRSHIKTEYSSFLEESFRLPEEGHTRNLYPGYDSKTEKRWLGAEWWIKSMRPDLAPVLTTT